MNEKEAEAQYEIISKMSFSEILELLKRGCDNPIYSRNLAQEDTIIYAGGFGIWPIESVVKQIEEEWLGRVTRELSFFIVSNIIDYGESDRRRLQYWMYYIRLVSDTLFKEVYTFEPSNIEEADWRRITRRRIIHKIDRPTIVFNVKTGDKWICDWKHPKEADGRIKSPLLKFHEGSGSVFDKSQIVIVNPTILSHYFLNWNSNPFEVKR